MARQQPQSENPNNELQVGQRISLPEGTFAAVDFETADAKRDSACAIGMVRVENSLVVAEDYFLIRPPREDVTNTWVHGLDWDMLKDNPAFIDAWPRIERFIKNCDYLVAHSASFDKSVFRSCCESNSIPALPHSFLCTVKGAKAIFKEGPYNLPTICERLSIPLRHHQALSDARASIKLLEHFRLHGVPIESMLVAPINAEKKSEKTRRTKKLPALTKADKEAIKEFQVIASAITCDKKVSPEEFSFIRDWLSEHKKLEQCPELQPVFDLAWQILEDGVATQEELTKMYAILADDKTNTAAENGAEIKNLDEKECPYCAEIIKAKAIVCKHCGKDLIQCAPKISTSNPSQMTLATLPPSQKKRGCLKNCLYIIIGLLILSIIVSQL